jgi:hypothetical protein
MLHASALHASLICEAIRTQSCLTFSYGGFERVVAPYCHGVNGRGVEVLRAIQLSGGTRSGGLGFGKLWLLSQMSDVAILPRQFLTNDPNYNPNDTAMKEVHCHV